MPRLRERAPISYCESPEEGAVPTRAPVTPVKLALTAGKENIDAAPAPKSKKPTAAPAPPSPMAEKVEKVKKDKTKKEKSKAAAEVVPMDTSVSSHNSSRGGDVSVVSEESRMTEKAISASAKKVQHDEEEAAKRAKAKAKKAKKEAEERQQQEEEAAEEERQREAEAAEAAEREAEKQKLKKKQQKEKEREAEKEKEKEAEKPKKRKRVIEDDEFVEEAPKKKAKVDSAPDSAFQASNDVLSELERSLDHGYTAPVEVHSPPKKKPTTAAGGKGGKSKATATAPEPMETTSTASALVEEVESMVASLQPSKKEKGASKASLKGGKDGDLEAKYKRLKEKYDELKNLRLTQPEEMLESLKSSAAQEEAAAKQFVSNLQSQLAAAQEELEDERKRLKEQKKAATKAIDAAEEKATKCEQAMKKAMENCERLKQEARNAADAARATEERTVKGKGAAVVESNDDDKRALEGFRLLTAMEVTPGEEGHYEFLCTNEGQDRSLRFEIIHNGGSDIEYRPIEQHINNMIVPDFLEDEILFDVTEGPVFMHRVLAAIYKRDKMVA